MCNSKAQTNQFISYYSISETLYCIPNYLLYVVMNLTEYYTTQGVKKYIWQLFSIVISLILIKSAEMRGGCED